MATLTTINERTTLVLTLAFFDEDDAAVTPTSAWYRVDDVGSGTSIVAQTALTGLSTTKELEITEAQNASVTRSLEERVVTVSFAYGSGRRGTDEYRYLVRNLYGVQESASPSVSPSPST